MGWLRAAAAAPRGPARLDLYLRGTAAPTGTLAWPADEAEQAFLADVAARLGGEMWIGLDDEAEEGVWRLPDGQPAAFFAWGDGRPNGAEDQNCVVLDPGLGGAWNDRECQEARPGICRLP